MTYWSQLSITGNALTLTSDLFLMTWMFPISRNLNFVFAYTYSYSYPPPVTWWMKHRNRNSWLHYSYENFLSLKAFLIWNVGWPMKSSAQWKVATSLNTNNCCYSEVAIWGGRENYVHQIVLHRKPGRYILPFLFCWDFLTWLQLIFLDSTHLYSTELTDKPEGMLTWYVTSLSCSPLTTLKRALTHGLASMMNNILEGSEFASRMAWMSASSSRLFFVDRPTRGWLLRVMAACVTGCSQERIWREDKSTRV